MKTSYGLFVLLACFSVSSGVLAQGRDHDGFMLRLSAGFGYASLGTELGPAELKLDGLAGHFAVDIGAAPVENLNLHARFAFASVASPDGSINGEEVPTNDDSSMMIIMFGPGITYYVMPANLYVTGAVGVAWAALSYEDRTGDQETRATDPGFGVSADVGWEFWVGRSWGLGPALRFMYISASDDTDVEDAPVWNGISFAVLFSGTFQ